MQVVCSYLPSLALRCVAVVNLVPCCFRRDHRIVEYSELEATRKDHKVQLVEILEGEITVS